MLLVCKETLATQAKPKLEITTLSHIRKIIIKHQVILRFKKLSLKQQFPFIYILFSHTHTKWQSTMSSKIYSHEHKKLPTDMESVNPKPSSSGKVAISWLCYKSCMKCKTSRLILCSFANIFITSSYPRFNFFSTTCLKALSIKALATIQWWQWQSQQFFSFNSCDKFKHIMPTRRQCGVKFQQGISGTPYLAMLFTIFSSEQLRQKI